MMYIIEPVANVRLRTKCTETDGIHAASIPSAGPVDPALIDDLVAASRILAQHGVLDAWGHVIDAASEEPASAI